MTFGSCPVFDEDREIDISIQLYIDVKIIRKKLHEMAELQ